MNYVILAFIVGFVSPFATITLIWTLFEINEKKSRREPKKKLTNTPVPSPAKT